MTEIPIIVSTSEVTVGGYVDSIQLELDQGPQGPRGSRIFTGTSNPSGLPVDSIYFGGYTAFVQGDLFIITSGSSAGNIYEYHAGAGWVQVISRWGMNWYTGTGTPEGNVTAPVGSLYTNSSGGVNTTLYVKTSGVGSTGWTAK
jgi:hypothetical protein